MAKSEPEYQLLPISDVELLEDNPRDINEHEFEKLCKDIKKDPSFLMQRPPLVNYLTKERRKVCYAGNQRLKAAKHIGLDSIHVWVEKNVSKKLQEERMLKDNLHRGEWNFDLLKNFDSAFLLDVGFSDDILGNIFAVEPEEDSEFDVTEALDEIRVPV